MNELPPQKLYERLREVTGARSADDLAKAVGESVRTMTRLKSGAGVEYERTIRLLRLAGYLRLDGEAEPLEAAQVRLRLQQAAEATDRATELVEEYLARRQAG